MSFSASSNDENSLLLLVLMICYGKSVSKLSLQSWHHLFRFTSDVPQPMHCRSAQLTRSILPAASFRLMVFANVVTGLPRARTWLRRISLEEAVEHAFMDAHIMLRIWRNYARGSLEKR